MGGVVISAHKLGKQRQADPLDSSSTVKSIFLRNEAIPQIMETVDA